MSFMGKYAILDFESKGTTTNGQNRMEYGAKDKCLRLMTIILFTKGSGPFGVRICMIYGPRNMK